MSYSHYHPAYPYGYPPHGYPSHPGYATPPHHPPHHGFYGYPAPPAAPAPANGTGNDLAAEEAAALAHLQAIQARRRAQEQEAATATRHAPTHHNFGEFLARAIAEERKREREEAERAKARAEAKAAKEHAEREARRAKEHAEREARKAKEEAERVARRARECAARHAEQAREEANRARAVAIAEARQAKWNAMMAARQRYAQQQVEARRQWIQQRAAQAQQVREALAENEYAQRAARYARDAAKPHVEKYANHIGQLNEVLGSLFGINLVQDEQPEQKEQEAEKSAEKGTEDKHVEFKEPVVEEPTAAPAVEEKKEAPATETKDTAKEQPGFPDSINDILGSFLGLRVEPTAKDTTAPSAPADLSGLNELLGRFGLVFEPETPTPSVPEAGPSTTPAPGPTPAPAAEASSSTTKPAPVHEETPLTSFLNGVTDLPPFVRDILGNLEQAWKEEATASQGTESSGKKDKGKGVAPGEKPARPTPAPETPSPAESDSSTTSLSQLSSISDELALVRDSFTFPSRLAFAPSTEGAAPALLFNKTNSTYHAQANKLLQLLLAADGVSSGGDREVRSRRKELVRAVESEIQELEKKRDAVWDEVKARREASGEISEDEDGLSTGSAAPSVIDHEEARDEVVFHYDEPEPEHVEHAHAEKVDGFEVPAPAVEAAEAETAPAPAAEAPVSEPRVEEAEEEETDKVDRKDNGKPVDKKVLDAEEYELL